MNRDGVSKHIHLFGNALASKNLWNLTNIVCGKRLFIQDHCWTGLGMIEGRNVSNDCRDETEHSYREIEEMKS